MRHVKFFAVGLAALVLLALVACGGDDDDTSNGGDGQEPTASEPADGDDDGGDDGEEPTEAPDDGEPTDVAGDDDDGDGNGGQVDGHACDLVTPEDVSAAVGVEVGEGRDYLATAADATNCEWQSTEEAVTVYAEVLLEGGRNWFEAVHFGEPAFEEQPVEGLGDEAIFSDLGVLDVVDGDTFISIQMVVFFSDLDELAAAEELARLLLERVP